MRLWMNRADGGSGRAIPLNLRLARADLWGSDGLFITRQVDLYFFDTKLSAGIHVGFLGADDDAIQEGRKLAFANRRKGEVTWTGMAVALLWNDRFSVRAMPTTRQGESAVLNAFTGTDRGLFRSVFRDLLFPNARPPRARISVEEHTSMAPRPRRLRRSELRGWGGVVCRRRLLGNLNRRVTKSRLRNTVPSLDEKRPSRGSGWPILSEPSRLRKLSASPQLRTWLVAPSRCL